MSFHLILIYNVYVHTHKISPISIIIYKVPWTGFQACSSPKSTHFSLVVSISNTCTYISSRFSVYLNVHHSSRRHTPVIFLLVNHSSFLFKGTSSLIKWIHVNIYKGVSMREHVCVCVCRSLSLYNSGKTNKE